MKAGRLTWPLLAVVVAVLSSSAVVGAGTPTSIVPVPAFLFTPVAISPAPTSVDTPTPAPREGPISVFATRPPIAQPTPLAKMQLRTTAPAIGKRRINGLASWYCNFDDSSYQYSICHHSYPDRAGPDLYAAACGKLRRAMGDAWRGRTVTVRGNGHTVRVRLIDFCASSSKTIDLYRDSMDVLGPSPGGYQVTISW